MKNLLNLSILLMFAVVCTQCTKDEVKVEATIEESLIGRWSLEGFDNIQYEFTADKRYGIYQQNDGSFPTLAEILATDPDTPGLDYSIEGDVVIIDLNFGNIDRSIPTFKCDNNVIDWNKEDGTAASTLYKVGHDLASCN